MQKLLCGLLSVAISTCSLLNGKVIAGQGYAFAEPGPYYWKATPVGSSAELLTLFCKACRVGQDTPLLAVLRDTLGDADSENDRLTSIWLLDYSPQNWHQRTLAAVPFFYWKVGKGSAKPENGDVKPLLNLSTPLHPMMSEVNQSLLQWTVFDPMTTAVRASSRAYRENEADHERLHLGEAISYLSEAPTGPITGTSSASIAQSDIDLLIARLSLRKRLLGGLVADDRVGKVGERERVEQERIRLRNWELLRQAAERTGLVFQPMSLSGSREDYAMLWFPMDRPAPGRYRPDGSPLGKILDIRDPWNDEKLQHWTGVTAIRWMDANGSITPEGEGQPVRLAPLAAYSLNYPRMPLLMVDFRSESHVRRHELAQRSVNQLVNGVIGVSYFANWYYFVGADMYSFVVSRRGTAQNRTARLDCYSEFRAELALDTELPPELRDEMRRRLDGLSVNPLEADPQSEVMMADGRFAKLQTEAGSGHLLKQIDLQRRAEVAEFGRGPAHVALDAFLHAASFGLYTHLERPNQNLVETLDRNRRVQTNIAYLNGVAAAGTQPEIAYDKGRIESSVNELSALLPSVKSERIKKVAARDLNAIQSLTQDNRLRADCEFALRASHGTAIMTETRTANRAAVQVLGTAK